MIDKSDCICVGLCARPHGVTGEVIVRAHKGFSVDDLSFEFLHLELEGGLVPFSVDEIRPKNQEEAILRFEDIHTQDQARRLADASIYIERDWLETTDEPSSSAGTLIGYAAIDQTNARLGLIVEIQEIAKNPLFVVEYQGRELLIPIVEEFIVRMDHDRMEVHFNLPEGLLDV